MFHPSRPAHGSFRVGAQDSCAPCPRNPQRGVQARVFLVLVFFFRLWVPQVPYLHLGLASVLGSLVYLHLGLMLLLDSLV